MDVLPRDLLAQALGGNPRVVAAFEGYTAQLAETTTAASDSAKATDALQDASYITLAPNATLTGERVLVLGDGLQALDSGDTLALSVNDDVPHVAGNFPVYLNAQSVTNLVLPTSGTLVSRNSTDTLLNKTLATPKVSGLGDYADDTAAAAGGVPIGGIYRTASVLKVRVS